MINISAKCSVCFKTISIAGQEVEALNSHAKSSKHNEKLPKSSSSIIKFTSKKAETSNGKPVTEDTSKSKKQSTITDFGLKTHTLLQLELTKQVFLYIGKDAQPTDKEMGVHEELTKNEIYAW